MTFQGNVDTLTETRIFGWAADRSDPARQIFVDIFVNSLLIASVRGAAFRGDLRDAGFGDGCKAFSFDPSPYLKPGNNQVELRFAGTNVLLPDGRGTLAGISGDNLDALDPAAMNRLLGISQQRWKGSEVDALLTWGRIFSGDSFMAAVQKYYQFSPEHHICEIGPGYGRLLKTILDQQLPFCKYTGIELSEERVARLKERFTNDSIHFVCADAATVKLPAKADLVICSSTFEHLFPDFRRTIRNLLEQNLRPSGCLGIDFIQADEAMTEQRQAFEEKTRAFVRLYSAAEIRQYYRECGLPEVSLESIVLGRAGIGDIRRIFAFAQAPTS